MTANKPTFIYTLSDPRNSDVRYVGMSKNPRQRWYQHHQCTDGSEAKKAWIQELRALRLKTVLTILEEVPANVTAWQREKHWIEQYTNQGAVLTNKPNTFEEFFKGYGSDEWNLKYRGSVQ